MKLTATMMLSVDGVHQAREAPGEPARFERWGWVAAYNDEETWRFLISMFERAGALLLGRPDQEKWSLPPRSLHVACNGEFPASVLAD